MVKKSEFYRMLKPQEVKQLIEAIPDSKSNPKNRMNKQMSLKTAFYTGMRYAELLKFKQNPKKYFNYNRKIIILPKEVTKTNEERKINLTPQFSELLNLFIQGNGEFIYPKDYESWSGNLRRWSKKANLVHPEDFTVNITRKTWESWLIESGHPISKILASQGHDMNTSSRHYYNNDVTPEERIEMKRETDGWS